jgi:hypothetical protein
LSSTTQTENGRSATTLEEGAGRDFEQAHATNSPKHRMLEFIEAMLEDPTVLVKASTARSSIIAGPRLREPDGDVHHRGMRSVGLAVRV